jgi:hypothetical protein
MDDGSLMEDNVGLQRPSMQPEVIDPMVRHPWHFLLVALAGFINRKQHDLIV